LAVVADQASNDAQLVDVVGNTVVATVPFSDPGPTGVAIDEGLGLAVVTALNANTVDTFTISSTPGTPTSIAVQQRPEAVAVDPVAHSAAVANTVSNTVSLVDLVGNAVTNQVAAGGLPAGIAFDPVSSSFLVTASLLNEVLVLNPVSQTTIGLRVGINPTSIAYNFVSGTLVTTNGTSQTMSVMDFLSGTVRAVLSFRPSGRFAVAIHPFTNLAVITDSANTNGVPDNKVYLRPLPR
jgi:serine/threonine-protein kinase